MEGLKIYGAAELQAHTSNRNGEVKIGQKAQYVSSLDEVAGSTARFVLLGIPEDIGVRANQGIAGAATAWHHRLKPIKHTEHSFF